MHSFALVEGRLGRLLESSHQGWYLPPLLFQSHRRYLQSCCHPRNWDLCHRHRNLHFVVLWINGEFLRRGAKKTDVTWSSGIVLMSWRSITICSPSPWWTDHDVLVNRNTKKRTTINRLPSKFPLLKLPAWNIYPNSIFLVHNSSEFTHRCMYEQLFPLRFHFFSDSAVGRRQGSPNRTVFISKSPTPGMWTFVPNRRLFDQRGGIGQCFGR